VEQVATELASAISGAYERLAATHGVVVVEGAGSCADLDDPGLDLANVYGAIVSRPNIVLVAGAQGGGAVAAIRGTLEEMPAALRRGVIGVALNDVRCGAAVLERRAQAVAADAGIAYLGAMPNCPIYVDIPPGQHSTLADREAEYDYLARFYGSHVDTDVIESAGTLSGAVR
jgi:adenosylcobyric acid synthase